jgi:DNA polymerase III epsilon subunit-like protein
VFLDTETTGLGGWDQIVEIAVIDYTGAVLIDTMARPTVPISPHAMAVHHITDTDVADACMFPTVWPRLSQLLRQRPVIIYNQAFDLRLLRQTADAHAIRFTEPHTFSCVMRLYATFRGLTRLPDAAAACGLSIHGSLHRAAVDAELTRRLVHYLAGF